MKQKKRRTVPILLIVLGLLLAIPSIILLSKTDERLEYALPAPDGDASEAIKAMLTARESLAETLADCANAVTGGAVCEENSVSSGDKSITATIYGAGEGWFEVYPVFLQSGRNISETELKQGDKVVLLDVTAAFQLFGDDLNEDSKVEIGANTYQVVGTFRHSRSVGESGEYAAVLPLNAAMSETWTTLMISANPIPESGARTLFTSSVKNAWRSDGSVYSLEKEAMRRLILPRMLVLVFGMSAIFALIRRMNAIAANRIDLYRNAIRWNYFGKTVWKLLALIGICVLGYGIILALLSVLMTFSIRPLYVFTEWVPDNFVAWSSLKKVFWSLIGDHAKLIRTGTPSMRKIEFEGGMVRWGTICVLTGSILMRRKKTER